MVDIYAEKIAEIKYTLLLVSLFVVQLIPVILGTPDHAGSNYLWGAVLLAAVYAASGNRRFTLFLGFFAALGFGGRIAALFAPGGIHDPVEAGTAVFAAAFLATIIFVIVRGIFRAPQISADTVMAALCIYLLVGFMWANFYALVELVEPGSFNFPDYVDQSAPDAAPEYRFGYYSFVTLTTLGYGDITPISFRARTLSWMEAVTGVIFMATTIAFLVSQVVMNRAEQGGE